MCYLCSSRNVARGVGLRHSHVKDSNAMKTIIKLFSIISLLIVVVSCGSSTEFRVDGVIEDLGTQNLRVHYYSGGAVRSSLAPAIDGKFNFLGQTSEPTLVQFSTNNGFVVGRAIVEGGDMIEARFNLGDLKRTQLKGNKESEALAEFIRDNADALKSSDAEAINRGVEAFVRKNPSNLAAGAVLTEYFDFNGNEALGLELLELLEPEARPQSLTEGVEVMLSQLNLPSDSLRVGDVELFSDKDSLLVFSPGKSGKTLLLFTDSESRGADSISGRIAGIPAGMQAIDISVDIDTATWHTSLRSLPQTSAMRTKARHRWAPGAIALEPLSAVMVGDIPFFAVVDSTGRVVYRGTSISAAVSALK